MKKLVILSILFFSCAVAVFSQDVPCSGVCVSREAAIKALNDSDRVKALEAEIKVKDASYATLRDALNDMRVEFARASGELTGLKTQAVRDAALIEMLSKMVRPKRIGFINLF